MYIIILCTPSLLYDFPLCHYSTTELLIFLLTRLYCFWLFCLFVLMNNVAMKTVYPALCVHTSGLPGKYFPSIYVQGVDMKGYRLCAFLSF